MSNEIEFTNEQIKRIDDLQAAAVNFFQVLSETTDYNFDLDDVYEILYVGSELLTKRGRCVRFPTHVTDEDGKEYISEWYGEDESVADMEHQ